LDVLISLLLEKTTVNKEQGAKRKGVALRAGYLADFGLNTQDIASILGSPVQSIRTLLTPNRRSK
jgi:hypothetical protein